MGHLRSGFLLIELLALILLITLLISLFIGGQVQLLKLQEMGVKNLQELNRLITENERARIQASGFLPSLQTEKFALTRPVITDSSGTSEKWVPSLICFITFSEESTPKKQGLWLPYIGVNQKMVSL